MSLAHCFGMVSGLLACVATGATAVLLESSRAEDIVSCVKRYNCTALHGVPTIFHRLLDHLAVAGEALHGVRTGIVAGAACSESLMRSIVDELGMKEVAVAYGQTETSPGCTQTSASDPLERKINTIGTPLPFVEMCVKAPSSGCPCATGERGELCTRGYHVMRGYLNDPQQTRTVIDPDGWLHSGDIGYADESGYYHFDSRLKELIIRGGENISPEEVEAAIITHPEVCDAKVFGVPSAVYGEEVAAFVQLKDGAAMMPEEMARYLNGKIAYFKIPVHFEFGFEMKTTPSGKVDVRQLREQMMSMLASGK
jgi:fatty-acyl-CoA synthase